MHEYTVELRVTGKSLQPKEITERLGLQPSITRDAGEIVGTRCFSQGVWGYNGSHNNVPVWKSLEEGLSFMLDLLEPAQPKLLELKRSFDVLWWCGHFQSS